jgi:hypothetical protein
MKKREEIWAVRLPGNEYHRKVMMPMGITSEWLVDADVSGCHPVCATECHETDT